MEILELITGIIHTIETITLLMLNGMPAGRLSVQDRQDLTRHQEAVIAPRHGHLQAVAAIVAAAAEVLHLVVAAAAAEAIPAVEEEDK